MGTQPSSDKKAVSETVCPDVTTPLEELLKAFMDLESGCDIAVSHGIAAFMNRMTSLLLSDCGMRVKMGVDSVEEVRDYVGYRALIDDAFAFLVDQTCIRKPETRAILWRALEATRRRHCVLHEASRDPPREPLYVPLVELRERDSGYQADKSPVRLMEYVPLQMLPLIDPGYKAQGDDGTWQEILQRTPDSVDHLVSWANLWMPPPVKGASRYPSSRPFERPNIDSELRMVRYPTPESAEDIHDGLEEAVQGMQVLPPMVVRQWGAASPTAAASYNPRPPPRGGQDPSSFVVMQFNTLADGLTAEGGFVLPFPGCLRYKDVQGDVLMSERWVEEQKAERARVLDWEQRRWRLLHVILHSCEGQAPDVIALEEVDHFMDFFYPVLHARGYQGVFSCNGYDAAYRAPLYSNQPLPGYSMGVALFWNVRRFALQTLHRPTTWDGVRVVLRDKVHRQHLQVVAVHLKSGDDPAAERTRTSQVESVLADIAPMQQGSYQPPTVILGDFNADPFRNHGYSGVEGVALRNRDGVSVPPKPDEDYPKTCVPTVLRTEFASAYPFEERGSKIHTSLKERQGPSALQKGISNKSGRTARMIDYILHNQLLRTVQTLTIPSPPEGEWNFMLPSRAYPSDHYSLAARLAYHMAPEPAWVHALLAKLAEAGGSEATWDGDRLAQEAAPVGGPPADKDAVWEAFSRAALSIQKRWRYRERSTGMEEDAQEAPVELRRSDQRAWIIRPHALRNLFEAESAEPQPWASRFVYSLADLEDEAYRRELGVTAATPGTDGYRLSKDAWFGVFQRWWKRSSGDEHPDQQNWLYNLKQVVENLSTEPAQSEMPGGKPPVQWEFDPKANPSDVLVVRPAALRRRWAAETQRVWSNDDQPAGDTAGHRPGGPEKRDRFGRRIPPVHHQITSTLA